MMGLASSIGGGGLAQCKQEKREGLPSLISPYCQINNILFEYLVLAYMCICLTTIGTYRICDSSRDVVSASSLWVLLGVYVGVAVIGFNSEIFLAIVTSDVDYLCHNTLLFNVRRRRTRATAISGR